jgi:hypothetical protein
MGICTSLYRTLFRKKLSNEMSRRVRIQQILENLSPAKDSFESKCCVQFSPQSYQVVYSLKEAVELIDRSQWSGQEVFSSEALGPIHKNSKVAYFPANDAKALKMIRAGKDAFHVGCYVFRESLW